MELEDKYKIYILCKEWHFKQKKIAELYEVSQSTISKYIKEVEYELKVEELTQERDDVKEKLDKASTFIEKLLDLFNLNRRRQLLENGDKDKRYLNDDDYRELDDDDDDDDDDDSDDDDGNGRLRPWHGVRKW